MHQDLSIHTHGFQPSILTGSIIPVHHPFGTPKDKEFGPFQISKDIEKEYRNWLIQERTMLIQKQEMLIQNREMEVLELQEFTLTLAMIAEILEIINMVGK